jgi:hypothetical protein
MKVFVIIISIISSAVQLNAAELVHYQCNSLFVTKVATMLGNDASDLSIYSINFNDVAGNFFEKNLKIAKDTANWKKRYFNPFWMKKPVNAMRKLFPMQRTVNFDSFQEIVEQLEPGTVYNFVITEESMTLAKIGDTRIQNFASKHAVISDHDPTVKVAGELWVDGVVHINNNSGTYQPTEEILRQTKIFFQEYLGVDEVVIVLH